MANQSARVATVVTLGVVVAFSSVAVIASRNTDPESIAAAGQPAAATPVAGADAVADVDLLAALDVGRIAPEVTSTQWLNTEPLTSADLAGKVVLYDFWTFGCINCRNTQPHVKAWHERYAADGLIVLSVHTPEFAFEADPANVEAYVAEQDLRYPVALDSERTTWRAFDNHAWPAFYLHDRQGRERYTHIGEGRYAATEDAIRALLGVDPASPRATVL